jgi:hypothetical protein
METLLKTPCSTEAREQRFEKSPTNDNSVTNAAYALPHRY